MMEHGDNGAIGVPFQADEALLRNHSEVFISFVAILGAGLQG
jgi:hypothetical protein